MTVGCRNDPDINLHRRWIPQSFTTEFIPLSAALKLAGVVGSGGEAKQLILDGCVLVNDQIETRRGAKIRPGDTVRLDIEPSVRIDVTAA